MSPEPYLSPRDLARAVGVSESSVKRWIDAGRIEALRTRGGHRRIPLDAALLFVREQGLALAEPALLGLGPLAAATAAASGEDGASPSQRHADTLRPLLETGDAARARNLLVGLFLGGWSVARILDGPLHLAMVELGELWLHGPEGIFVEHRATAIAQQIMTELRQLATTARDCAPLALGGAGPHDAHALGSFAAAAALAEVGMRTVDLGALTPLEPLRIAIERLEPRLVWLSLSTVDDPRALAARLRSLLDTLRERGAVLALGGRAVERLELAPHPALFVGASMGELAAFARGLVQPR